MYPFGAYEASGMLLTVTSLFHGRRCNRGFDFWTSLESLYVIIDKTVDVLARLVTALANQFSDFNFIWEFLLQHYDLSALCRRQSRLMSQRGKSWV